jgi:hypothetical protein
MDFSHEAFVRENLDLFAGGTEIEGACLLENVDEAFSRAGLIVEKVSGHIDFDLRICDYLLFTHWKGLERDKHFVRLLGFEGDKLVVMNPADFSDDIAQLSWIRSVWRIKKR